MIPIHKSCILTAPPWLLLLGQPFCDWNQLSMWTKTRLWTSDYNSGVWLTWTKNYEVFWATSSPYSLNGPQQFLIKVKSSLILHTSFNLLPQLVASSALLYKASPAVVAITGCAKITRNQPNVTARQWRFGDSRRKMTTCWNPEFCWITGHSAELCAIFLTQAANYIRALGITHQFELRLASSANFFIRLVGDWIPRHFCRWGCKNHTNTLQVFSCDGFFCDWIHFRLQF